MKLPERYPSQILDECCTPPPQSLLLSHPLLGNQHTVVIMTVIPRKSKPLMWALLPPTIHSFFPPFYDYY